MPNTAQLFLRLEKIAADLVKDHPTLIKTVLPTGVVVISGSLTAVNQAKQWLDMRGHSYSERR